MSQEPLKMTAVTAAQASQILSAAYSRRITEEQVLAVVEAGELARADGTFSLFEYVAYLAQEATAPALQDTPGALSITTARCTTAQTPKELSTSSANKKARINRAFFIGELCVIVV